MNERVGDAPDNADTAEFRQLIAKWERTQLEDWGDYIPTPDEWDVNL